jgi:hypothetical protein
LAHFGTLPLFSDPSADPSAFWSEQSAQRRAKKYDEMLESGERSISSVGLINQWLAGINARYNPVLTAYNIAFDFGKCRNTRINLGIFNSRFCLMKAAKREIGPLAEYQEFCQAYGLVTARGNVRHTADAMAKFVNFSGERYGLMRKLSITLQPHHFGRGRTASALNGSHASGRACAIFCASIHAAGRCLSGI